MNQILHDQLLNDAAVPSASSSKLQALIALIAEGSAEREASRTLPFELIGLIRQARLGALTIPAEAGGGGASFRALFEVVIRLGAADANVAHILRNHFVFVERYARRPRDAQQRLWQQAVLDGAIVGLANNEPAAPVVGASPLDTVLRPDGDGFRITGRKFYSTGTLFSDLVLVRVSSEDGRPASAIIPLDRAGIELVDDWDGVGQRLTGSGTTLLTDVRVEAAEVVYDTPTQGYGLPYSSTLPQLYLTAVNAGILRAVLADATALVRRRERSFFFAPAPVPTDDPILQQVIGEISSAAFVAEVAVLSAAEAQDAAEALRLAGQPDLEATHQGAIRAAKAKVVVDDLVIRSGSQLFDVGGASAALKTHNLDRHWRNARTLSSHNPRLYKARAIGQLELNGTALPSTSFF
ncbi:putative acyl-CoA dehydrogenase [Azorhizobium oxalatiphilum]|uniref:Acyl-CoA dehydrogenase n=1 Tax=Azorhizobium oxalatiphilum TaxID=980631 RepID=A0A917BVY8_9HYPH|nr:acyl-CoA dehydrogenase [Azorhizobium oxalatiphilum]GGF58516.1 putative acyl-CoA dehydrogenase [Azorhizobium oxalatiphilum]